jgi:hypothetical protein
MPDTTNNRTCDICDKPLDLQWCDVHGVASCITCGTPYRVLHYENGKRVDKPVTLLIKPEWVPIIRRYWAETKRHCDPASAFNFPGDGFDTPDDLKAFEGWMKAHEAELPQEAPGEAERGQEVIQCGAG